MSLSKKSLTNEDDAGALLPDAERRADDRVQTVFRVARVICDTDEGLARIRNMSDHGAGLRLQIPVTLADSLTIQLVDGVALRGQVVWKQDDALGIRFDEPIGCSELLTALAAAAKCGATRPVRLPLEVTALTRSERGLRSVRIVDISQRGLKLVHDGSLNAGLDLMITLPNGLERAGKVRWSRDNKAGVMLLEPLSVEALGSVRRLVFPSLDAWVQK